jgi:hypothetical protein
MQEKLPPHIILFTGHMIDTAARKTPRFPPESEELAREMIKQAVENTAREANETGKEPIGISGGASGGDILFQEVCNDMGIETRLYLALPRNQYIETSVAPAGDNWRSRFNDLFSRNRSEFLQEDIHLPGMFNAKNKFSIWTRSNLWMLHTAIKIAKNDFTLIALWNGEQGDGPGGTKDMVARARARGGAFIHLDAKKLLRK